MSLDDYGRLLADVPALAPAVEALLDDDDIDASHPAVVASAIEFILEGLHLSKRLNKNVHGGVAVYRT